MKAFIFIAVFFYFGFNLSANDYSKEMRETIKAMMAVEGDSEKYLQLANKFEELGKEPKADWLPSYYAALSKVWATFSVEDKSNTDAILDECTALLDKAAALGGEKSELLCVRSLVASGRIMVSPLTRGMKYGMRANDFIDQAKHANPSNPRVYFVEAQSLMYTPVMFGGGCENALVLAKEAIQKYKAFKPQNELMPNWGLPECQDIVDECS